MISPLLENYPIDGSTGPVIQPTQGSYENHPLTRFLAPDPQTCHANNETVPRSSVSLFESLDMRGGLYCHDRFHHRYSAPCSRAHSMGADLTGIIEWNPACRLFATRPNKSKSRWALADDSRMTCFSFTDVSPLSRR